MSVQYNDAGSGWFPWFKPLNPTSKQYANHRKNLSQLVPMDTREKTKQKQEHIGTSQVMHKYESIKQDGQTVNITYAMPCDDIFMR
jgi:hypothetical protein